MSQIEHSSKGRCPLGDFHELGLPGCYNTEPLRHPVGSQETRIVSETGGEKGSKLARFDLMPWSILREVAEHFGRGARKYEDRNWERGYAWSLSFAALHRHLEAFWSGEDIDDDPSLYLDGEAHTTRHIIAVVWHALCLAWFSRYRVGTDDRPNLNQAQVRWVTAEEVANGHTQH